MAGAPGGRSLACNSQRHAAARAAEGCRPVTEPESPSRSRIVSPRQVVDEALAGLIEEATSLVALAYRCSSATGTEPTVRSG